MRNTKECSMSYRLSEMYKLTTYLKDLPLQSVSSKKNLQVVDKFRKDSSGKSLRYVVNLYISLICISVTTGSSNISETQTKNAIVHSIALETRAAHFRSEQFYSSTALCNDCQHQYLNTAILDNFQLMLIDLLYTLLTAHPDRVKVNYVVNGLRGGFSIAFKRSTVDLKSADTNCWSAQAHPDVIDKYLDAEIQARRVVGHFESPPCPDIHTSRFGVIPKKRKLNSWRLILDLSFLSDHSVNDGISKSDFPAVYSTVQDAIRMIVRTGKGALMAKVGIEKAYRILPIHPEDWYFLVMKWRNKYFVDLAPPFGLRSAPGIFNTLADLFEWILQNKYDLADILHNLDDYFTLGPAGTPTCSKSVNVIQQASRDLGLPLAPDKCEGPTTCLIFLGIELNSVA